MLFVFSLEQLVIFTVCLLVVLFLLYSRKKEHHYKFVFVALFGVYTACFIRFALAPSIITGGFYEDVSMTMAEICNFQVIPFYSINSLGGTVNVLGNIALLFPAMFFLGFMRKDAGISRLVFLSFLIPLGTELVQLAINLISRYPNHVIDIDDLILNCLGALFATLCFYILRAKLPQFYSWIEEKIVRSNPVGG